MVDCCHSVIFRLFHLPKLFSKSQPILYTEVAERETKRESEREREPYGENGESKCIMLAQYGDRILLKPSDSSRQSMHVKYQWQKTITTFCICFFCANASSTLHHRPALMCVCVCGCTKNGQSTPFLNMSSSKQRTSNL